MRVCLGDLTADLGGCSHYHELIDSGDRGPAEGPVHRLPAHPVLTQARDDVGGRYRLPFPADAFDLDDPLVAVARPESFAMSPFGVEDPGLEPLLQRIPADALGA